MLPKSIVLLFVCLISLTGFSQTGNSVYSFLDLPVSSRIAALGGSNISLRDNDLSFAFRNPALLSAENDKQISLSMANYLADIKFGSAMYGFKLNGKNLLAAGIQYIDYGVFDGRDELNRELGEFEAKDMALNIVYSRPLTDKISVGGAVKFISSVFGAPIVDNFATEYSSYGVAMDAGANYSDPKHFFSAGLVLRNLGTQIKGYYSNEDGQHFERLPFDIQLGLSKKLTHAPFRFSLTLHNLQQWNLSYQSTNESSSSIDEDNMEQIGFVDMAFRHTIFGVEFVPGKNFYLAAAYNHRRHNELKMPGFKSAAGFSFGGGIKLYKFQVGFGSTTFQTGNVAYQFSIATSLNQFKL